MMIQTIHEVVDRFDVKVRELGDALVLFMFSGSTSSNPYFMVRLYSNGQIRMVDIKDVLMYGDPGNIKDISSSLENKLDEPEKDVSKTGVYSYSPLANYLTIKQSPIHGLGLFTKEAIYMYPNKKIQDSHFVYRDDKIEKVFRLECGGYINHSENPNIKVAVTGAIGKSTLYGIFPLRKIDAGEELTLDYRQCLPKIGLNPSNMFKTREC